MEQKQSSTNKKGVYLILLVLFLVVTVSVRAIQLLYYTDYQTGFYTGPESLSFLFFGALAAVFVLTALFLVIDRSAYAAQMSRQSYRVSRVFALLCGFFTILSLVYTVISSVANPGEGAATKVIEAVFMVLSAFGFFYLAVRMDNKKGGAADILLIFPAAWACFSLFSMFLDHMMVATVYENLINILRTAALSIFLLHVGRVASGLEKKSTNRWLVLSGMMAVILGFCATASQYIQLLVPLFTTGMPGQTYQDVHVLSAHFLDFVVALFCLVFLVEYLCFRKRVQKGELYRSGAAKKQG